MQTLCQTEQTSCIACCIREYLSIPENELETIFERRAIVKEDSNDMFDYNDRIQEVEPDVPFCKFIGYIDDNHRSVGCIIHPDQNGIDLRQDPRIKRSTCLTHSCDSHKAFKNADENTRESMLEFLKGMGWYRISHFMRKSSK